MREDIFERFGAGALHLNVRCDYLSRGKEPLTAGQQQKVQGYMVGVTTAAAVVQQDARESTNLGEY